METNQQEKYCSCPQTLNSFVIRSTGKWILTRKELLRKEKHLPRLRDQLAGEPRAVPWVTVEKEYVFDAPASKCRSPIFSMDEGRHVA